MSGVCTIAAVLFVMSSQVKVDSNLSLAKKSSAINTEIAHVSKNLYEGTLITNTLLCYETSL